MRKNRGYKKGESFRDARLFVVACEGEKREKEYFERLGAGSRRLKIHVLAPDAKESLSAPKWLLDRLVHFIEKEGVNIETGDVVWVVMDVDRWKTEQLYELANICQQEKWGYALSNPCFEVWLMMHVRNINDVDFSTCKELKHELGKTIRGGYNVERFASRITEAISRADAIEDDVNSPIPGSKISRVHLAVKALQEML
jgi:hypothetical protein